MSRNALIVALVLLMLSALGFVLWLGSGSAGLPRGADPVDPAAAPTSTLSADPSRTSEGPSGEGVAAGRSSLTRESTLDPDVQRALSGFRGRVVDYRSQPVAACGVRVYRFAMDSVIRPATSPMGLTMEPDYVAGETLTDEAGRFLITGVWPQGLYLLLAGIGTDNPRHQIVQQTPGPGEIVDLGDIQLDNGAVLTGTVVDPDNRPVPGALVRAVDLPGAIVGFVPVERFDPEGAVLIREEAPIRVVAMPPWVKRAFEHLPIPTTRTDADGRFRLVGLAPAPNLFAVTHPGFLSEVRPRIVLDPGEERDLGRVRLREGEMVIGRVQDSAGEPVAGAEVVAAPTTSVAPVDLGSFVGPTDAEGKFEAEGFPRGRVTVAARRGPGYGWVLADPQPVDQDVILTLPAHHGVTITVLGEDGEMVKAPRFRLLPISGEEGSAGMATMGLVPPVPIDDRLSKLEDGRHRIDDLSEGSYTLLTTAAGYSTASARVPVGGETEVTVTLAAQLTHRVLVVDSRNRPIRQAQVYAQERGPEAFHEMPLHVGVTRSDGRLSISEISTAGIRLTARHPAYGMAHAEGTLSDGEIVITMLEPGSIEGLITERGAPPLPGKWTIVALQSGGGRGALEEVPHFATPDLEGRFRLEGLQPGRYQLLPIKSLDLLSSPGSVFAYAMEADMMGDPSGRRVEVASGQVAEVELEVGEEIVDGPAGRITGQVMVDGQPGTGLRVLYMGQGGRKNAEVDEAGRFDLGYVPAGEGNLGVVDTSRTDIFEGGRAELWREPLEVVANEDQDRSIEIETGSLVGFVFDASGFAAVNVIVSAEGRLPGEGEGGSRVSFTTQTDSRGRFEFLRIPAATYAIRAVAMGEDSGRAAQAGIQVSSSLPTPDVQLTLTPTIVVSGTVDLSELGENRPGFVMLEFVPERADGETGGRRNPTVMVRRDGVFETDELLPGTYRVRMRSRGQARYEHPQPIRVGSGGLRGVLLRPVRRDGPR